MCIRKGYGGFWPFSFGLKGIDFGHFILHWVRFCSRSSYKKRYRTFVDVVNWIEKIADFGHKWGRALGKRATLSHPNVVVVPPGLITPV